MWKSEFLAHSFSILIPLIPTILLVISEAVVNVFMASYFAYSVTIKVCQKH